MIQELLAYQEVDQKLKAIEMGLSANEDRKKAVAAKKFLEGVGEAVERLDQKAGELAQSYKQLVIRQNELIENVSEYDAVADACGEDEIEYVHKKAKALEDRIYALQQELKKLEETIESVVKQYAQLKTKTVEAQKQYKECGAKYNQAKAAVQKDRDSISKELDALAKKVDPALMEKYLARRKDKMSLPILVEYKGRCSACGMELSLKEKMLLTQNKIGTCENCHKLIFIQE